MKIRLAPSVRLPYSKIRGSLEQRQQAAIEVVDKLCRELYPKFDKNKELSLSEIQKSIDDIFEKKVKIIVKQTSTPEFDGSSDVVCSPINGSYTATTLELNSVKGKIKFEDLITIIHEFQHIVDQLFIPKYLIRGQKMTLLGMITTKYQNLYDKLYNYEYPTSKADKRKIIKLLEHKIKKFLRGMNISEKMDYIQDARYSLIMEEQAYRTQRKYAKIFYKKHLPIKEYELEDEISLHMLKEKIQLLTRIGFELVEKERGKHAAKLKAKKLRNVKANQ
ncbi:hypothetical protein IKL64_01150 [bacterium]|nr:hypothetical protein [bacterium]